MSTGKERGSVRAFSGAFMSKEAGGGCRRRPGGDLDQDSQDPQVTNADFRNEKCQPYKYLNLKVVSSFSLNLTYSGQKIKDDRTANRLFRVAVQFTS